ncbi:Centrin [Spironucleus salmonicida]|uniref:Centrin n=1 Tax=Spironucleus salmonicida TaxID=348837 RepID=V6LY45_9EUKA|nr:Centrin [Spironucleus salmonicida]|eukprot:EST48646.1 Centrin [Spironucleus salmonicida]
MNTVTAELKAELYETFKAFDLDGNGFIDIAEIETMLKQLHIKYTRESIVKNVGKVDEDGNGYMDFDEFCKFMTILKPQDKETELKNIFRLVDKDDSGEIDRKELQQLLVNIGHMSLTEQDIDDMFEVIDFNADGKIQFQEFHDFFQDLL